jgi:hypothetical protein
MLNPNYVMIVIKYKGGQEALYVELDDSNALVVAIHDEPTWFTHEEAEQECAKIMKARPDVQATLL